MTSYSRVFWLSLLYNKCVIASIFISNSGLNINVWLNLLNNVEDEDKLKNIISIKAEANGVLHIVHTLRKCYWAKSLRESIYRQLTVGKLTLACQPM